MLHLIKLSVGTTSVDDLAHWQAGRGRGPDGLPRHVTRMWPTREAEILDGGSIYWVIKGLVSCRQRVLRLDEVRGGDGVRRCAIVLDPDLVRVAPSRKSAFQGWRYLATDAAPTDLTIPDGEMPLPPGLAEALAEFGVV